MRATASGTLSTVLRSKLTNMQEVCVHVVVQEHATVVTLAGNDIERSLKAYMLALVYCTSTGVRPSWRVVWLWQLNLIGSLQEPKVKLCAIKYIT